MAEIKIEKKALVWPWILAALVIAGLLVYFFMLPGDSNDDLNAGQEEQNTEMNASPATAVMPGDDGGAVASYVAHVDAGRNMTLDHDYTSGAISKLTEAVRAKAAQLDLDVTADLMEVEQYAKQIQQDPMETTHANSIRSAADILARAMGNMQQRHYPDLNKNADQVKEAATRIDPNTLTLEQRDAVKDFFDRSASLLQGMK